MMLLSHTDAERADLKAEYPHEDNWDLAERYGVSVGTIERFARAHGLRKDPARTSAKLSRSRTDSIEPAVWPRIPVPRYPGPDYCRACGMTNECWPGCDGAEGRTTVNEAA